MRAFQPLAQALLASLRDMAPILATITLNRALVLGVWSPGGCWRVAILVGLALFVRGLG